jgi:RNA polymerase sigma factor (sigma-70 family)
MKNPNLSDEELINRIMKGSLQDFQIFYERHFSYVYKIVFAILKNDADALDVCQDLFLEYYHKASTYQKEKGSVKAWITIRAKSRAIDFMRKKYRVVLTDKILYDDEESSLTTSVEEVALANLEKEKLIRLLKNLPPLQKEAIYFNYAMSLSHRETAKKLNRPLGTVKSLIRYGVKKLRKDYFTSELKRGDQHDA